MHISKYTLRLRFHHASRSNGGFTLIETLVACTILTIALVSFLTLIGLSLRSFMASRETFIASKIAQEGMELIVNKRDNNVLCLRSGTCSLCDWRKNLGEDVGGCVFPPGVGHIANWEVDATKPDQLLPANAFTQAASPGRKICRETAGANAGKYKQCAVGDVPIPGNYARVVTIDNVGDCSRLKVHSNVTWTGVYGLRTLELEEVLFGLPPPAPCTESGGGTVSAAGLVAHWEFDEDTGTTASDSSGNGHTGTLVGGPAWVAGQIGNGVQIDAAASQHVSIGDPSDGSLDFGTNSFSYGVWVYVSAPVGNYDMPWFKGGASAGGPGYDMELGTGQWTANFADGTQLLNLLFSASPILDQWVHLFVVLDRSAVNTAYAYTNGVRVNTQGLAGFGSVSTSLPANIGKGGGSAFYFNGIVDDVRIYNRALSQDEVAALYDEGANP